jgi:hypothetical protein
MTVVSVIFGVWRARLAGSLLCGAKISRWVLLVMAIWTRRGLGAGIATQPAAFGAMLGRVAVIPCGDELEIEEIRRRVSRRPVVAHKSICCDLQLK